MKKIKNKLLSTYKPIYLSAFTLVELIVVITILAILATIAFISLSGYSQDARNSSRASDVKTIEKALQVYGTRNNIYPAPEKPQTVSYSGEVVYYQGTFGDSPYKEVGNLSNIPLDPLTEEEYIYSVTVNKNQYEILAIYEGEIVMTSPQPSPLIGEGVATSIIPQTHAAETYKPKVTGTYNKIYVKTENYYIPLPSLINAEVTNTGITLDSNTINSQVITNGTNLPQIGTTITSQTGGLTINLISYAGNITSRSTQADKVALANALQTAYTGTTLATKPIYQTILSKTTDEEKAGMIDLVVLGNGANTTVAQTTNYSCDETTKPTDNGHIIYTTGTPTSENQAYVQNETNCGYSCTDGYTGTSCETAPDLITSTDCTSAGWYWVNDTLDTMGSGYCISPRIEANGDTKGIAWQDVGTSLGWTTINYATTEGLSNNSYGVTAYLSNYTCGTLNSGHTDVLDYGDTVAGRMKWLSGFANTNNNETELANIDWINITTNNTSYAIPSIYIADCIDGIKDLTTDMILGAETITRSNYTSTTDSDATRTIRNKYLLGWAKSSGSHLPSAYSSIDYEVGDNLTGDERGEYQVACENNATIGGDLNTDISNEWIWTSAIGNTTGSYWGRTARVVGYYGCGDQHYTYTGNRNGTLSARFVVRP
ncbi:MAG: prepilin-type N-terminal cleavage/methylation domain-containing protein [Candidatus Gracilibacteria bacterium]|nr:prepilin-type N-terminal cleavage/methylation domain-containing protein [Candidatus Gracilibacteria bacterium]